MSADDSEGCGTRAGSKDPKSLLRTVRSTEGSACPSDPFDAFLYGDKMWKVSTAYEYTALRLDTQQIRLVELAPSPDFEDDIHFRVTLTRLNDGACLQYCALSYVWGTQMSGAYT